MGNKWNEKCRFFNEKYACDTLSSEGLKSCSECKFASPYDKKILIIKLGALGDVLRTTPILEAIKAKYPESLIYWLVNDTYGQGMQLFQGNPYIDKLLIYNLDSILRLQQEKFDIIYSLEIDTPGTLIANLVKANEKFGYFFSEGATSCFNKGAEEYLETAFLTHAKLANRKTYQQLIFQAACLEFNKQEIVFASESDVATKRDKPILGINFGSGLRWQSKSWADKQVIGLIKKIKDRYSVILLAGPDEEEKLNGLLEELKKQNLQVSHNNPKNSLKEFASVIASCNKIITTDSMTLHLAAALKKPTIALFFSTPDWEIEDYGRIKKIVSPLLKENFFSMRASEQLANSISAEDVLKVL